MNFKKVLIAGSVAAAIAASGCAAETTPVTRYRTANNYAYNYNYGTNRDATTRANRALNSASRYNTGDYSYDLEDFDHYVSRDVNNYPVVNYTTRNSTFGNYNAQPNGVVRPGRVTKNSAGNLMKTTRNNASANVRKNAVTKNTSNVNKNTTVKNAAVKRNVTRNTALSANSANNNLDAARNIGNVTVNTNNTGNAGALNRNANRSLNHSANRSANRATRYNTPFDANDTSGNLNSSFNRTSYYDQDGFPQNDIDTRAMNYNGLTRGGIRHNAINTVDRGYFYNSPDYSHNRNYTGNYTGDYNRNFTGNYNRNLTGTTNSTVNNAMRTVSDVSFS